jgi:hypothetical protein
MWKVFGLKILGALVDGGTNAGGIGTRYRRSGIASALDKTADLLFGGQTQNGGVAACL